MFRMLIGAVVLLAVAGMVVTPAYAGHRLGGGVEYLRTLGDIKDSPDFDANSFGFLASYQYASTLFRIEGDLEWIIDYGGTSNSLIQPQAYLLVGGLIYAGAGIGTGYFDGDWWNDPFYSLRAGADLSLAGVDLDVFALYRFHDTEVLKDLGKQDLDSITFGALIRFSLGQ